MQICARASPTEIRRTNVIRVLQSADILEICCWSPVHLFTLFLFFAVMLASGYLLLLALAALRTFVVVLLLVACFYRLSDSKRLFNGVWSGAGITS